MKKLTIILRTAALLLTASVLLLTHLASEAGEPKLSEVQQKYQELWKSGPRLTKKNAREVKFEDAGYVNAPAPHGTTPNLQQIIWGEDLTSLRKKEPQLIDNPSAIRRQLQAIPAELKRGPMGEKLSRP